MWTIEWTNVKNVSEKFTLTRTRCANCHSALLSCASESNRIEWMEVAKLFVCLFVYSLQYCLIFNRFHSLLLFQSLCFSFEIFTVLVYGLNSRIQINFSYKKEQWSKRWISQTTYSTWALIISNRCDYLVYTVIWRHRPLARHPDVEKFSRWCQPFRLPHCWRNMSIFWICIRNSLSTVADLFYQRMRWMCIMHFNYMYEICANLSNISIKMWSFNRRNLISTEQAMNYSACFKQFQSNIEKLHIIS